jgi:tRNA G26 N,N-dimethylase Trm1
MRKINVMTICKSCNSVFDGQHLEEKCPECGEELVIAGKGEYIASALAAYDMVELAREHAYHEYEELLESLEDSGWVYDRKRIGFKAIQRSEV